MYGTTLDALRAFTGHLGKIPIALEKKNLMQEVRMLQYDRDMSNEDMEKLEK